MLQTYKEVRFLKITARYTNINFKKITRLSDLNQITFGVSKYVVGHSLKIQADISLLNASGIKDNVLFRTGFDLHF